MEVSEYGKKLVDEQLRKYAEGVMNSDPSPGSYNANWLDGFQHMAEKVFDLEWDIKSQTWKVNMKT